MLGIQAKLGFPSLLTKVNKIISDARVEVSCDKCDDEVIEIDLEYVYSSYSGNSGNYSLRRVEKDLNDSNWTVDEGDDEKHYCEFCSQEDE